MGQFNKPVAISKILDRNGKVIFEHKPNPVQVCKPGSAYMLVNMMEDVMRRGTGTGAAISRPCAGKTGTTSEYRDAWFVGFTPNLSAAVWIGDDNNDSLGGMTGGGEPATLWHTFMAAAVQELPSEDFKRPDNFKMPAQISDEGKKAEKKDDKKKKTDDKNKKATKNTDESISTGKLPGGSEGSVPRPPSSGGNNSSLPKPVRPPSKTNR
jgi:penicillin-binding protein 1A